MAINDLTRTLTKSTSQSETATAIGHAEDISPIITNIDPDLTFFLSSLGTDADATTLKFSWLTEGLKPPQVNAQLEKFDFNNFEKVGSLEGKDNNVQFFYNSGYITDVQEKVKKVYSESEIARETANMLTRHARDIEYAIVNNSTTNAESGSTPAMTGGIPYFMQSASISATVETSAGVVTAASAHGLTTGDFVYFTARTMPTGISANTIYYVRVGATDSDTTNPDTKFRIFNTMKGAVENIVADQVVATAAGTSLSIVLNNIVDKGNAYFTLDDFDNAMELAYNRGGNPTMAVMSPAKKKAFSKLIVRDTQVQMNRDMKNGNTLNVVGDVYQGDFGVVTAHAHRMYPDNRVDILDLNYWDLKWFERTHQITDLPKRGTYTEFAVMSALGLKGTQPKASASIVNVKR